MLSTFSLCFPFSDTEELHLLIDFLKDRVLREGRSNLLRHLKRRDALRRQREAHCDVINDCLHKRECMINICDALYIDDLCTPFRVFVFRPAPLVLLQSS